MASVARTQNPNALIKAKTLQGYRLECLDGEIGKVKEFYFDDQHWTIRYLVVDTGTWLASRQVLISPHALGTVSTEERHIAVALSKKQIEESPSLGSDKPVSRQFEEDYSGYYGWPTYWNSPYMWGSYSTLMPDPTQWSRPSQAENVGDHHLRSTHDVSGHHIQATDGEIGHVADFIIDDGTWAVRYLVIDTQNWWPGKKVLVAPQWIERVSWDESKVFVNLTREAIRRSPEYTADSLLTREYETGLYRHYERQGYWVDQSVSQSQAD